MFSFTIYLIVFIVVVSHIYFRFCRSGRLMAQIPGPTWWPILGNSYKLILSPENLFLYLRTLPKTYGDVIGFGAVNVTSVNIYHPDDIETLFSSITYNKKQEPYTFLSSWLGEGLLISNGKKWRHRRKMLTNAFHFSILKKYSRTFTEQAEVFLEKIKLSSAEPIDVVALVTNTTLRTLCETAMGTSMKEGIDSVSEKYFKAIHIIGHAVVLRLTRIWLFYDWIFNLSTIARSYNKAVNDTHALTRRIIEERKSYLKNNSVNINSDINDETNKKKRLAMLDLLIQNENDGLINSEGIREEVDTFLFEGHDTTSMALCFFITKMANEPEIQSKVYKELQKIFGDSDRPASLEDLSEMRYLECCIKESLRLYPAVPYVGRYLDEDVVLGGYTVPKHSMVQLHIYDVHRRADFYPDPERFIPERFLPENCTNRHPYSYIPFSAGPRNCIGQKFAMLEMKTLLSSLFRRYRLEAVTKESDLVFSSDIVLRTNHPIYVRFHPR